VATGGDSPSVAESYNNVGCIYKVPGKYKGALEMHTIVLEIRTQVSGYAMA
jgi:lipoprotein NlpI